MSLLAEMANRYIWEGDDSEVEEVPEVEEETPEYEPEVVDGEEAPEVEEEVDGGQSIVDTLMSVASEYEKTIHSMLKYAANTDDDENVFDDALRYYEDNILNADESEEPEEAEEAEDDIEYEDEELE